MSEEKRFMVHLQRKEDYKFEVEFDLDSIPPLQVDEPPPLGDGEGPNPARMVAIAAANCLAASLLFCLEKTRTEVSDVSAEVIGTISRNDKGRLRLTALKVKLEVEGVEADNKRVKRCLGLFEDFCVVTEALRNGIPIDVDVVDGDGNSLLTA